MWILDTQEENLDEFQLLDLTLAPPWPLGVIGKLMEELSFYFCL